jgi:hypothetical protein
VGRKGPRLPPQRPVALRRAGGGRSTRSRRTAGVDPVRKRGDFKLPCGGAAPLPQGGPRQRVPPGTKGKAGGPVGVCPGLYDDPHRLSLTGGAHSSSRVPPRSMTLPSRPGGEPHDWRLRASTVGPTASRDSPARSRTGFLTLRATLSTGRPTLYPERGARCGFPPLRPRPGLPGSGEPFGPAWAGVGRGRRRRRRGPQRGSDQRGAVRLTRGQPVEVVVHVNDDWVAVEALPAMTGQAALTAADRREATPRPGNAAQAALVRFLTP